MAASKVQLGPLSKDGRLQACRPGGLEDWMAAYRKPWRLEAQILVPWRLAGLPAGLEDWIDWIRLDASGCCIGVGDGIG